MSFLRRQWLRHPVSASLLLLVTWIVFFPQGYSNGRFPTRVHTVPFGLGLIVGWLLFVRGIVQWWKRHTRAEETPLWTAAAVAAALATLLVAGMLSLVWVFYDFSAGFG